jgi:hypothetical protein
MLRNSRVTTPHVALSSKRSMSPSARSTHSSGANLIYLGGTAGGGSFGGGGGGGGSGVLAMGYTVNGTPNSRAGLNSRGRSARQLRPFTPGSSNNNNSGNSLQNPPFLLEDTPNAAASATTTGTGNGAGGGLRVRINSISEEDVQGRSARSPVTGLRVRAYTPNKNPMHSGRYEDTEHEHEPVHSFGSGDEEQLAVDPFYRRRGSSGGKGLGSPNNNNSSSNHSLRHSHSHSGMRLQSPPMVVGRGTYSSGGGGDNNSVGVGGGRSYHSFTTSAGGGGGGGGSEVVPVNPWGEDAVNVNDRVGLGAAVALQSQQIPLGGGALSRSGGGADVVDWHTSDGYAAGDVPGITENAFLHNTNPNIIHNNNGIEFYNNRDIITVPYFTEIVGEDRVRTATTMQFMSTKLEESENHIANLEDELAMLRAQMSNKDAELSHLRSVVAANTKKGIVVPGPKPGSRLYS